MASNMLNPARAPGESFDDYKTRRQAANKAVKKHLKGRMLHESVRIVPQPMPDGTVRLVKDSTNTYVKPKE